MEAAGLGLAIFAAVDLCVKYGKVIYNLQKAFRDASKEITERFVRVHNILIRAESQLRFLLKVWDGLEEELQMMQRVNVSILEEKLERAVFKIEGVIKRKKIKPKLPASESSADDTGADEVVTVRALKYAVLKQNIDKTIKELGDWQDVFDPSWYLIMKAASPVIDAELNAIEEAHRSDQPTLESASRMRDALRPEPKKHVEIFLPKQGIDLTKAEQIPFSTVQLVRRSKPKTSFIVESAPCPPHADQNMFTKDVRTLARKLHDIDPLAFGLLDCKGAVRERSEDGNRLVSVLFVFRMPEDLSAPRSLRGCLLSGQGKTVSHSLSERFRLARELTRAVSYIHTFGFVHKNIRPETILLLQGQDSTPLGTLFLVGLEDFRTAEGKTMRISKSSWERDLYRHPSRQGERPTEDYIMQHDIYSLGVCLLEIGLYGSFVEYGGEQPDAETKPSSTLLQSLPDYPKSQDPQAIKGCLLSLAQSQLPELMGNRYAYIVQTCLTCLDPDNEDFGNEAEFADEQHILVNIRYIEKILSQLNEISV